MDEHVVALIAGIFAASALCQWLAWRIRLPPIVLLLAAGIAGGPVLGLVAPQELMGDLFFPFVSMSVAIILFEGSLTLRFSDIPGLGKVVSNLLSVGMLLSWLVTTLAARLALGVSWQVATLFGAIMVVTGPTVIAPLLRTVRPSAAVSHILRWESILIDSIGASLAVLVFEFIVSGGGQFGIGQTLLTFTRIVLTGSLTGIACGHFFGLLLRHRLIPEFLQNISTLGTVFAGFALANILQTESGLITVTVMGIWLANMRGLDLETIHRFKEPLSTILISMLFITLAARLEPSTLIAMGWPALAVLAAVQFIARPLSVLASTAGSDLSRSERYMLSWIAPRGIVAAAISALFAYKIERAGIPDAGLLVPLSFLIIIGTVLLQGATARPLARRLGVMQPEPLGFLIIGANPLARRIAAALHARGVRTVLVAASAEHVAQARAMGLEAYQGNPLSDHTRNRLNLSGIGALLALSSSASENLATCLTYQGEFGKDQVYAIRAQGTSRNRGPRVHYLFHPRCTFEDLNARLALGGRIGTELYNDGDPWDSEDLSVLFTIDEEGRVSPRIDEQPPAVDTDWQVIRILDPPAANVS